MRESTTSHHWTLSGTLSEFDPQIPLALVSQTARAGLRDIAASLPASLSNWVYLECRLGDDPAVDLALYVEPHTRACAGEVCARLGWREVRELVRRWESPVHSLHHAVEGLWLELDVDPTASVSAGADHNLAPSVFVDFTDDVCLRRVRVNPAELALKALAPLLDAPLPAALVRTLRRCVGGLPPGAFLLYVGAMLSRRRAVHHSARVCLMGLEPDHVLPYLRTVRWPGDEREVAGAILLLVADRDASMPRPSILVQMDIGREVEPRLGIELAFARRPQLRGAIAESSLLNRLVTLGLCTPAKREALASWPAYEIRTLRHELWPSLVVRRVNHVKIVLDRERPMSAKSYLCIHHAFRAGVDGPSDGNRGASLFLGTLPPAARDPTATRFA